MKKPARLCWHHQHNLTAILEGPTAMFQAWSKGEALAKFGDEPNDLLDGILSANTTILYGASGVGKGRLLAEMIAAGLNGTPFAGREWTKPLDRVAVIGTDSGAAKEYATWVHRAGAGVEHDENVKIYEVDHALGETAWRELNGAVGGYKPSLVIIDSTTEIITGSVNDDTATREFWRYSAPLRVVPFVMVHHVAKPGPESGGRYGNTPIGSALWTNYSRNKINIYGKGLGTVQVDCRPRHAGAWSATFGEDQETGRLTYRESETSGAKVVKAARAREDRDGLNGVIADWVVANCQGMTGRDAGAAVYAQFPTVASSGDAVRQRLSAGRDFGALLTRDGTTWSRATQ